MPQPPAKKARYEQRNDKSLSLYMPKSASLIGASAVESQFAGKSTNSEAVRVKAQPFTATHMGQGLHEVAPTSLHSEISAIPNPRKRTRETAAEIQSGARTTPALTPLLYQGKVLGHTGTFVNPAKKGSSTNTSGQAGAHDHLRDNFRSGAKASLEGDEFAVHMANAQFQVMPRGKQLMTAPEITGAQPNLKQFGPIESPTAKVRSNRIGFAQQVAAGIEESKARGRAVKRSLTKTQQQRTRSPSPERTPIDASGKGGDYIKNPKLSRVAELPEFPSKNRTAHTSAWIFEPLRLKPPK